MATRFYFGLATYRYFFAQGSNVPPQDTGWVERSGLPRLMSISYGDLAGVGNAGVFGVGDKAADYSSSCSTLISLPILAGITFLTADTIKCVARCSQSNADDNVNRQPITVRVISVDGKAIRKILKPLGHYGPTTDPWNLTQRSRQFATGQFLDAEYTTIAGDRLVVEFGGQVSGAGGTSVSANIEHRFGAVTDLAENETDTSGSNSWFEISTDIQFMPIMPDDEYLAYPIWANKHRIVA